MTIVEIVVAAGMLAVLLASSVHVLRGLTTEQRAAERRTLALQTVQNLAEQVGNTPWEQLTPEAASQLAVPVPVKAFLPGAKLAVTVVDEREPIVTKRVSIALVWNAPNGQPVSPIRLTSWVFDDEGPPR